MVLISRTQHKLDEAATDISKKYKVETKVVAADLSVPSEEKWATIRAAISQLDVGILINNAGRSYDHAEYLDAVEDDLINSIIELNIQAVNKVGRFFLASDHLVIQCIVHLVTFEQV